MRLLAATDFSDPAGLAVDRAVSLASLHPEASLTLMHVQAAEGFEVVRHMFSAEIEKIEQALAADAAGRLNSLAARCEEILECTVETLLSRGRPETEIVGAAAQRSVDLIVMGERERANRPFLGGTIERVIQRTNCSVLAVKQPVVGPYRRLLVGVSSGGYSPTAAELAFLLNPGSDITLLHAFEAPFEGKFRQAGTPESWITGYQVQSERAAEQELAHWESRLEAEGIQARRIVVRGSPVAAIRDYGRSLAADLIVVGKHNRSVLGHQLFGDVARQVTVESTVDVLVAASLPDLNIIPDA